MIWLIGRKNDTLVCLLELAKKERKTCEQELPLDQESHKKLNK